jgi:hypothetical protein
LAEQGITGLQFATDASRELVLTLALATVVHDVWEVRDAIAVVVCAVAHLVALSLEGITELWFAFDTDRDCMLALPEAAGLTAKLLIGHAVTVIIDAVADLV